ncbi:MAG: hypothetical protein LKG23_14495 [Nitrospira sp.]|jgi:hypothetical protein|nr:hypothetical protein [Nitrospira sp.]
MPEHDLEKLLGGFAANTLTPEERSQLYKTALQDQQLFNALADEQALKELLSDPAVRRKLLETLARASTSEAGESLPWWAWFKRPAGLAFAGGLAAVIFALAFGTRIYQESLNRAASPVATEDARQAAPSVQAPQPSDSLRSPEAESRLKAQTPGEPGQAPSKKNVLTGKVAKQERSATATLPEQRAAETSSDLARSPREHNESSKPAPAATPGRPAEQAAASPDKTLSLHAPSPAAAPAPAQAARALAPKHSARALFYGEASPRVDTNNRAQESEEAGRLERRMDQFAAAGKTGAVSHVRPLGLRYSFVTKGPDGQSREVGAAIAAGSKEPVRITVETTQDAYLQILQNLGSAGTRLWWPPQETGKISLKLLAGKRSDIPLPPPAENGLLDLIVRLSPKPFGPLTMQEVGMLDRFSANLLIESISPVDAGGAQEQATYVVSQDPSTNAQLAVEIPISQ